MTPARKLVSLAATIGCLPGSACKNGRVAEPEGSASPPVSVIQISPATVTMGPGDTVRLTATSTPAQPGAEWLWTSSDSARVRADGAGLARAVGVPIPGIVICAALKTTRSSACASVVVLAR
jgi:uncharacterized protein YjdB